MHLMIQTCEGMSTLHNYGSMNISHGRLKPQNILIDCDMKGNPSTKIAYLQTIDVFSCENSRDENPTAGANINYSAPELLETSEPD